MIAPETEITLYKTDVEIDELNNIKFNTWTDQWNYFSSLPKLYLDEATYQRKEGVIRYPNNGVPFDELLRYNYVSYKNSSYSSKTFFAFIKNMRYVNDGMTEIEIESDVWQTWQFDIIYRKCFTEREHVKDDTFGLHTVPEGLETGEYMYQPPTFSEGSNGGWDELISSCRIVFALTNNGGFATTQGDREYNGVYSGLKYYAMRDASSAETYINYLSSQPGGIINGLYAIFLVPDSLLDIDEWILYHDNDEILSWYMREVPFSNNIKRMGNCYILDQRKCGTNYHPKNNKVLCYPYRYITVSNNAGITNNYRYEYFRNNTREKGYYCEFGLHGALSIGCCIKLFPLKYDNPEVVTEGILGANYLEGVDCYKLPTCSWLTDPFLNWLSANAVSLSISSVAQVGSIIGGAALTATGAGATVGAGLIMAGASGIFSTLSQAVEHAFEPETAHGGTNLGELNFKRGYSCYCRSIRDEYAKIIDDYFSMFGYKVNALKVPEIHSRKNWNYIKTIDCNFSGDIPGSELEKIRDLFNRGITLWHNPSTFLDYSQTNNII